MKRIILALFLICPVAGFSQQASFFANLYYHGYHVSESNLYNYVQPMKWWINGELLQWNSDTLYVPVDLQTDTILFQRDSLGKTDTLICNIRFAHRYQFVPNPCCGGFNIVSDHGIGWGSVKFEIVSPGKKNYAGQIHETGILLHPDSANVVSPQCISAMAMNVYPVSLYEFRYCDDVNDSNCTDHDTTWMACMNDSQYRYDEETGSTVPGFAITKKLFSFIYLPLSDEPLVVKYNAKSRTITIF